MNRVLAAVCSVLLLSLPSPLPAADGPRFSPEGNSVWEGTREIPVQYEADVVVVHAGISGVMGAIAAQRKGANTILVEAGGRPTMKSPLPLGPAVGIDAWKPNVSEGMFREFAEVLVATGQFATAPKSLPTVLSEKQLNIRFHDTMFTAMAVMLRNEGVRTLFHTMFVDTVDEEGVLKGIVVEAPQGRVAIRGKVFIDATDLADVAHRAGAPTRTEEPFMAAQAVLVGVDEPLHRGWTADNDLPLDSSFRQWMEVEVGERDPSDFWSDWWWDQWWNEFLNGNRYGNAIVREMREAWLEGELVLADYRQGATLAIPEGIKTNPNTAHPRTYVTGIDPTDLEALSWAEVTGRLRLHEFQRFFRKRIPGFETSALERISVHTGPRGGRFIDIPNPPTDQQVESGQSNPDAVFVINRGGGDYGVPYRIFLPQRVENLLVAETGQGGGGTENAAFRTGHHHFFYGHVVGTAAALAVRDGTSPRNIDVSELQSILRAEGVEIPQ